MPGVNKILEFCATDTGTNLLTDAAYAADAQRPIGNQPGIARSPLVNKSLRQTSVIAAALAQFIADNQGADVTDSLTPTAIAAMLVTAFTAAFPPPASEVTGVYKDYIGTTAPAGYVLGAGKTIGSAASGATERANADTATLYALCWTELSNTVAPVSGGRGVSAAADFAANKTLQVPDLRGRVRAGKDDMGGTAANRITNAVSGIVGTTNGASGGAEGVTLTTAQIPSHLHGVNDPTHFHSVSDPGHSHSSSAQSSPGSQILANGVNGAALPGSSTGASTTGISINATSTGITIQNQGGGGSHTNVQPTWIVGAVIIKL